MHSNVSLLLSRCPNIPFKTILPQSYRRFSWQWPPPSHRGWVISAHAPILSLQCPPPSRRGWVISAHAPILSSQCPPPSHRGWVISAHAPILSSQCPPPSRRGWVISAHAPILSLQCPPPSRRGWVIIAHAPVLSSQCPPPSHRGWVISTAAPLRVQCRLRHRQFIWNFLGALSQSRQTNAAILRVSEIDRGRFLSHTFQFVVIRHPTVYSAKIYIKKEPLGSLSVTSEKWKPTKGWIFPFIC